jgi:hypothetical protein
VLVRFITVVMMSTFARCAGGHSAFARDYVFFMIR